jgi:Rrf2 family transcriptional regulator, iron-sulfur cluster assembly transcription factor
MQLSTRGRYAVMAMVELASHGPLCSPICLAEIAASQQLSLCYLEQLFARLRRAGLVRSVRGPGGGYALARPAGVTSIAEILSAVNEPIHATRCEGAQGCMGDGQQCRTHDLWAELGRHIALFLDGITLDDVLADRVLGRAVGPEPRGCPERPPGRGPGVELRPDAPLS